MVDDALFRCLFEIWDDERESRRWSKCVGMRVDQCWLKPRLLAIAARVKGDSNTRQKSTPECDRRDWY